MSVPTGKTLRDNRGIGEKISQAGGDFKTAVKDASSSTVGKVVRGALMPGLFLPAAVLMASMAVVLKGMDLCWSTIHKTKWGQSELVYDPFFHNASAAMTNSIKGLFWFTFEPYYDLAMAASDAMSRVSGSQGGRDSQKDSKYSRTKEAEKPEETAAKDAEDALEEARKAPSRFSAAKKAALAVASPILLPFALVAAGAAVAADKLAGGGFARHTGKKYQVVDDGGGKSVVSGKELDKMMTNTGAVGFDVADDGGSRKVVDVVEVPDPAKPKTNPRDPRNCKNLWQIAAGRVK